MFAKVKNDQLICFPYGYDELQKDNKHTKFTGDIDLKELFNKTEAHLVHGYDLVSVVIDEKSAVLPEKISKLSETPVLEDGIWVLKRELDFIPQEKYCSTYNPFDSI